MAENREGGEGDGGLGGGGGEFPFSSSSTGMVPSVSVDIQAVARGNGQSGWRLGRQMHRVPLQLRLMQPRQQYMYDPITISIGPYHHGKPHLSQLEEFKTVTLELFLSGSDSKRNGEFFYTKIYEQIDEIRSCYVGVLANEYDDAVLSKMMLRDACFIIYFMKANVGDFTAALHMLNNLGLLTGFLTGPDTSMLENQIPYWVIKFLMCSKFGEDEWKALIRKHLSDVCFGDVNRLTTVPWEEGEGEGEAEEPLHLFVKNTTGVEHAGEDGRPTVDEQNAEYAEEDDEQNVKAKVVITEMRSNEVADDTTNRIAFDVMTNKGATEDKSVVDTTRFIAVSAFDVDLLKISSEDTPVHDPASVQLDSHKIIALCTREDLAYDSND